MFQDDLFRGKTVLVTGGRSGIGFATARMYLELGASVVICSRRADALADAARQLEQFGPCESRACDIREPDDVAALADFIQQRHDRLDILVNNAGGQFPSPAEAISPGGWAAVITNNLNGTFHVTRQMARSFFIPQKEGIIVNITAEVSRGFPGMAHTGAARAGVENLTKTLAQEWAEYNIRVNAVAPGIIASSGLDTYPKSMQPFFERARATNLMKRFGTPEEVAYAVLFLSCPLSAYTSGTILHVDGLDHLAGQGMSLFSLMKQAAAP